MNNFLSPDNWSWTPILEQQHQSLLSEFEQFDPTQWIANREQKIDQSGLWSFVPFMVRGQRIESYLQRCPTVAMLLNTVPMFDNCTFSIMGPDSKIDPHQGHSDQHLRVHLCLKTQGTAWIQVGDEKQHWQTGKVLIFQDRETHSTANPGTEDRVVLLFDVLKKDYYDHLIKSTL